MDRQRWKLLQVERKQREAQMPLGAIARKLRREAEAKATSMSTAELPPLAEPMLTVRLDEVPADADLSFITADAYPVEEFEKPKRKKKVKPVEEEV